MDTDELPPLPDLGPMWTDYWLAKVNGLLIAYGQACAAAAVAREREACAALCDDHASIEGIAQRCAAAIRAR